MPDLKTELLADYSKRNTIRVVKIIGCDEELFGKLMDIFFDDQKHVNKVAAWTVRYCYQAYPYLVSPYLKQMVDHMRTPNLHQAFKRPVLKIFEEIKIPEILLDDLFEICYEFLTDPKETTAVRVYSMQILFNISLKMPELQNELSLIIEDQLPYGTIGFQNRGNKILNHFRNRKMSSSQQ